MALRNKVVGFRKTLRSMFQVQSKPEEEELGSFEEEEKEQEEQNEVDFEVKNYEEEGEEEEEEEEGDYERGDFEEKYYEKVEGDYEEQDTGDQGIIEALDDAEVTGLLEWAETQKSAADSEGEHSAEGEKEQKHGLIREKEQKHESTSETEPKYKSLVKVVSTHKGSEKQRKQGNDGEEHNQRNQNNETSEVDESKSKGEVSLVDNRDASRITKEILSLREDYGRKGMTSSEYDGDSELRDLLLRDHQQQQSKQQREQPPSGAVVDCRGLNSIKWNSKNDSFEINRLSTSQVTREVCKGIDVSSHGSFESCLRAVVAQRRLNLELNDRMSGSMDRINASKCLRDGSGKNERDFNRLLFKSLSMEDFGGLQGCLKVAAEHLRNTNKLKCRSMEFEKSHMSFSPEIITDNKLNNNEQMDNMFDDDEIRRFRNRLMLKSLSVEDHGGLEGCLKVAAEHLRNTSKLKGRSMELEKSNVSFSPEIITDNKLNNNEQLDNTFDDDDDESRRTRTRLMLKSLSMEDHGGLEGCLKVAAEHLRNTSKFKPGCSMELLGRSEMSLFDSEIIADRNLDNDEQMNTEGTHSAAFAKTTFHSAKVGTLQSKFVNIYKQK